MDTTPVPSIACDQENCDPAAAMCVVTVVTFCVAVDAGTYSDSHSYLRCDGPEDCASGNCCTTVVEDNPNLEPGAKQLFTSCNPAQCDAVVCHSAADCGAGLVCCAGWASGLGVCQQSCLE